MGGGLLEGGLIKGGGIIESLGYSNTARTFCIEDY